MAFAGLDAVSINYFIGFHNHLMETAKGKVFISLCPCNIPAGVKIDYEIIPPHYTTEIMKALDIEEKQAVRLKNAMELIEVKNLTYLGIRFSRGKLPP